MLLDKLLAWHFQYIWHWALAGVLEVIKSLYFRCCDCNVRYV